MGREGEPAKDVANQVGDCTDYCESAHRGAGLPGLDPRPATSGFASSSDYRALGSEAPQAGDVIVQGGHAGIFSGQYDSQDRPLGIQNGGSGTKVIPWGPNVSGLAKVNPVFYRRQVPKNP